MRHLPLNTILSMQLAVQPIHLLLDGISAFGKFSAYFDKRFESGLIRPPKGALEPHEWITQDYLLSASYSGNRFCMESRSALPFDMLEALREPAELLGIKNGVFDYESLLARWTDTVTTHFKPVAKLLKLTQVKTIYGIAVFELNYSVFLDLFRHSLRDMLGFEQSICTDCSFSVTGYLSQHKEYSEALEIRAEPHHITPPQIHRFKPLRTQDPVFLVKLTYIYDYKGDFKPVALIDLNKIVSRCDEVWRGWSA